MKALGNYLREERIARGISLESIENKTRIRRQHLVAIENGDFHRLPEQTYAKAFLRHYVRCVGLDEADVLRHYDALAVREEQSGSEHSRSERRARQVMVRRRRRLWQWIGVVVIVLLMAIGQWWVNPWGRVEQASTDPTPSEQQATASIAPTPVPEAVENERVAQSEAEKPNNIIPPGSIPADELLGETVTPGTEPLIVPAGGDGFSLTLHAIERSWVELWADGERRHYRTMEAGEVLTFEVAHEASLRLGRAENVHLTVDDTDVGVLGTGIIDQQFVRQSLDG